MVLGKEKRINEKLRSYWESKCAGKRYPLESQIDPAELGDVWPACYLVHVEGAGEDADYKYVYLGESLVEAYGDDLGSKEICEKLAYPANNTLIKRFSDVVSTKEPATEESEFTNTHGMLVKFRTCMLPLGKHDDSEVNYIIGAMRWKAV